MGHRTAMLEQYLVILFVKLAVSTALASILARPTAVQRMLLLEERTLGQRMRLSLAFAVVFGTGAAIRILSRNNYQAVDIGLEGSILAGLVAGYVTGLTSGILISLPAMLLNGELLTMPLFAGLGVMGGLLRDLAPEKEEIWRFSPFFDLGLLRLIRKQATYRQIFFQHVCLVSILFAEFLRMNLAHNFGFRYLFVIYPNWPEAHRLTIAAAYGATLFAVTLPLKVWNTIRVERKLESQQVLLTEARLAALARQINPHFLFNTLNSISTLVRLNPDQARTMRRLLRKQENVTALREELAFIDDYLSIEMVRFGDKLKVEKKIDPETLDMPVPSMLLQPLVENSIKHGLSGKIEGGHVRIESSKSHGMLLIAVEDDGVGIPEERLATLFEQGIGVSNVNERLQVLYGNQFRFTVLSRLGEGTRTEIEIPVSGTTITSPEGKATKAGG
jgi:two-component system LytT family sensor kinase